MKKIILPGLVAGIAMLAVSFLMGILMQLMFPSLGTEFTNISIFRPWSDPLMWLFYLHPFLLGILLAWAWNKVKGIFKQKDVWNRGTSFGLAYWAITSIPGMFVTYSSFQLSLLMVITWALSGLGQSLVAGWIFARMNK